MIIKHARKQDKNEVISGEGEGSKEWSEPSWKMVNHNQKDMAFDRSIIKFKKQFQGEGEIAMKQKSDWVR